MSLLVEWFCFVKYLLKAFFACFQVTYNFFGCTIDKKRSAWCKFRQTSGALTVKAGQAYPQGFY